SGCRHQRGLRLRAIEFGQYLAGAHTHAFFRVNLLHPAGDLGCYCGAASRSDVAAGIEQSLRTQIACRPRGGHFHYGPLRAEGQQQSAKQHQRAETSGKQSQPLAGLARTARAVVDLKRAKVATRRCCRCAHREKYVEFRFFVSCAHPNSGQRTHRQILSGLPCLLWRSQRAGSGYLHNSLPLLFKTSQVDGQVQKKGLLAASASGVLFPNFSASGRHRRALMNQKYTDRLGVSWLDQSSVIRTLTLVRAEQFLTIRAQVAAVALCRIRLALSFEAVPQHLVEAWRIELIFCGEVKARSLAGPIVGVVYGNGCFLRL